MINSDSYSRRASHPEKKNSPLRSCRQRVHCHEAGMQTRYVPAVVSHAIFAKSNMHRSLSSTSTENIHSGTNLFNTHERHAHQSFNFSHPQSWPKYSILAHTIFPETVYSSDFHCKETILEAYYEYCIKMKFSYIPVLGPLSSRFSQQVWEWKDQ